MNVPARGPAREARRQCSKINIESFITTKLMSNFPLLREHEDILGRECVTDECPQKQRECKFFI